MKKVATSLSLKKKKIKKEAVLGLLFVLIPLAGYTFFHIFSFAISFVVQFADMQYYDLTTITWNNFANFKEVFADEKFFLSIGITFWVSGAQLVSLLTALVISVLLHRKHEKRISKLYQVVFFIPFVCSWVAVSVMWKWMFNSNYGIINNVLEAILGEKARVSWFIDTNAYPWMLFIVTLWHAPGYGMIMYKSALGTIDPALYEAAQIDGAGEWQKFLRITFPALGPMTFFLLMLGIIAGMQTFDVAKIFAGQTHEGYAGPHNVGLTLMLYIYQKANDYFNLPVASVMSWFLFLITFILAYVNTKLRKLWVSET